MTEQGILFDIVILLSAAVLLVPLAQKLGLGSVLGYLIAGIVVGPYGASLIGDTHSLEHTSELGVVFLLFVIGLELEPRRLWAWKARIFGLGFLQVLLVTGAATALGVVFSVDWKVALVAGLGLSMSSTAIASQVIRERNLLSTPGGSSAFSVLLFQDLAVIPILALVPLLAGQTQERSMDLWKVALVLVAVVVVGRFLIRHVLRLVASVHLKEVFTALSLLLVVGLAYLMQVLSLSMAMGAFMGGVLLATSEYRHAIETDIEPFKGLFLGLFFMTVGMSLDLNLVLEYPLIVVGLVGTVLIGKMLIHLLLGKFFKISNLELPLFSSIIAQVGEFSFVIFALAVSLQIMDAQAQALLSSTVALSMAATPLLLFTYDKFIAPRFSSPNDYAAETIENDFPEVIIAGFGRVGQIIGRLLYANQIRATVLDHDPDQIELLRQFGFKVYFGDATRVELLEAAGARTAKVLVVAVDNVEDSLKIVDVAQEHFRHLKLVVRARNVRHVYDLIDKNVTIWERETFESSLKLASEVLKLMGWPSYMAARAGHKFRDHNLDMIDQLHKMKGDQSKMVSVAKQAREDLMQMFSGERESLKQVDESWEIHPDR